MNTRCSGHCCRAFYLPFSHEELRANWRAWRDGTFARGETDVFGRGVLQDIDLIYPMVRPLGHPRHSPAPLKNTKADGSAPGHYYTCVHLRADGDCGIYADRPAMCRDYPYGIECNYAECTWSTAAVETHALPPVSEALVQLTIPATPLVD